MRRAWFVAVCVTLGLGAIPLGQGREWWPGTTYDPGVPTPRSAFGYDMGDYLTEHAEMTAYMRQLETASNRVKVFSVGRTNERRELLVVAVSVAGEHPAARGDPDDGRAPARPADALRGRRAGNRFADAGDRVDELRERRQRVGCVRDRHPTRLSSGRWHRRDDAEDPRRTWSRSSIRRTIPRAMRVTSRGCAPRRWAIPTRRRRSTAATGGWTRTTTTTRSTSTATRVPEPGGDADHRPRAAPVEPGRLRRLITATRTGSSSRRGRGRSTRSSTRQRRQWVEHLRQEHRRGVRPRRLDVLHPPGLRPALPGLLGQLPVAQRRHRHDVRDRRRRQQGTRLPAARRAGDDARRWRAAPFHRRPLVAHHDGREPRGSTQRALRLPRVGDGCRGHRARSSSSCSCPAPIASRAADLVGCCCVQHQIEVHRADGARSISAAAHDLRTDDAAKRAGSRPGVVRGPRQPAAEAPAAHAARPRDADGTGVPRRGARGQGLQRFGR